MAHLLTTAAPWYVAGPSIGFLIVLLLWIANQPFGVLGGYIEAGEWMAGKRPDVSWRTVFIGGIVVGGCLSAMMSGGWHVTLAYGSFDRLIGASLGAKVPLLAAAGGLMGAGGRLAGGCTSGHGLCGTSFGSPASVLCTATFMITAIACAFAIAWLTGAVA
jgi:uncharacterized protein